MQERSETHGRAARSRARLPKPCRRRRLAAAAPLAAAALLLLQATSAQAAVSHAFDQPLSEALGAGVPSSASVALTGPLSGVNSIAVDAGKAWIAERIEAGPHRGRSRVDAFDAKTGKWLERQLDEERSVTELDHGVAVGHAGAEEQVYVGAAHEGQNAVAVFGASDKVQPQGIWSGTESAEKSFGAIKGVAIDHSTNPETQGDVLVAAGNVIDVYPGEAGGKEPKALGQIEGPETPCSFGTPGCANPLTHVGCKEGEGGCVLLFVEVQGVAVSPANGDVLVSDGNPEACVHATGRCAVEAFEPVGGLPGAYAFAFAIEAAGAKGEEALKLLGAVSADGEGHIYVVEKESEVIDQYGKAGQYEGRLRGTPEGSGTLPFVSLHGVATDPASGAVLVGDYDSLVTETGKADAFGPSAIVPDVQTLPASKVEVVDPQGKIDAQLNGRVNPLNEGQAQCRFAWGQEKPVEAILPCKGTIANGNSPVQASETLEALAPDTTYLFRAQASNANGSNLGEDSEDEELKTPGPGIHGESVAKPGEGSASLQASIDPNGAPTSYFFEYGPSSAYGKSAPAAPGTGIGEGHGDVAVPEVAVSGLSPGSVYHYRVVAVSTLQLEGKATAIDFAGPDHAFKTRGAPGSLPDGRRWEQVTPADKHGAVPEHINESGLTQAAADGQGISYLTNVPTEEDPKGLGIGAEQSLASRSPAGWSAQNVGLPHEAASGVGAGEGKEYRANTEELSASIVEQFGPFTTLSPEVFPPDTELTPYLRHNATCAAEPGSCFEPLLLGCPEKPASCPAGVEANADVRAGTKFAGKTRFVGASADMAHVLIGSRVQLTATALGGPEGLYEWSAGKPAPQRLSLISVLGGGEAASNGQLGQHNMIARGAVSSDGSRVFWSNADTRHLYLRDTTLGQTLQLDTPEAACLSKGECGEAGEENARFQLAGSDGSWALFTDSQRLSADAGQIPGKADLYECLIHTEAGKLACALKDLTPAPGAGKAADVQGAVIGASADGGYVYFVANGVLGDGAEHGAVKGDCKIQGLRGEGACNLYVEHEGAVHLIAVLSGADYPDWTGSRGLALNLLSARVSPNGQWLAFMSERSLTGYDNRDANSGKPDEEVYLYGASEGSLACASCDPSGARPVGREYEGLGKGLAGGAEVWQHESWIAANVPGYTPYRTETALYQSRYLSNSGRLFFNSSDKLLPQDKNKAEDVYQYEPEGLGSCSSGAPGYEPENHACLAMISSGAEEPEGISPEEDESAFLDASESGNDVFFLTDRVLARSDIDNAYDIYDAHVCSEASPCIEEPPEPEPPCASLEKCRPLPVPSPAYGPAPSSTPSGSGNFAPKPPLPPAPETNAQRLAKALKACRSRYKRAKKRRLSCEASARKRYGAKKPAHKKSKKRSSKRGRHK